MPITVFSHYLFPCEGNRLHLSMTGIIQSQNKIKNPNQSRHSYKNDQSIISDVLAGVMEVQQLGNRWTYDFLDLYPFHTLGRPTDMKKPRITHPVNLSHQSSLPELATLGPVVFAGVGVKNFLKIRKFTY